ncbi:MAG: ABC transporter permease [Candidatus Sulfopaludibacter sp.]|nr:ABC transporter permease [Candidatus Sulfopaludibacter sp.]
MKPLDHLDDDIRDHIERETRENIERGMAPEQARSAALRKFGNVARVMEQTRDVWRWVWLEQLQQDVRYGLRFMFRNPRFAAVVLLTLALGIGVNTAVFSVVNTVLLQPLAYPNPDRLVWLGTYDPQIKRDMVAMPEFYAWRQRARSITAMAAFGYQQAAIETPQGAAQITGVYGAGDFWKLTGAHAAAGRLFGEEEQDCLVLSWDLFQRQFAGDPRIIGQPVVMNGRQVMITGVLPRNYRFQFPMWWVAQHPEPVEAYFSAPPPAQRSMLGTQVVGLLKPGVPVAQANAEINSLEKHLWEQDHGPRPLPVVHVDPLQQQLTGSSRRALLVLLAAGAFVLLIATINVANLLLARATLRRREVGVRAAVGAGRSRVIRNCWWKASSRRWPAVWQAWHWRDGPSMRWCASRRSLFPD